MNKVMPIFAAILFPVFAYATEPSNTQKIYSDYDQQGSLSTEFDNIYDNFQRKEFTILSSTPVPADYRPGEMVIQSTGVVLLCSNVNGNEVCWPSTASVTAAIVNAVASGTSTILSGAKSTNLIAGWVHFVATGTMTVLDKFNVSSVSKSATGVYTVNFTNAFANNGYACNCTSAFQAGAGLTVCNMDDATAPTTSAMTFHVRNSANADFDPDRVLIMCSGTQ